MLPLFFLMIRKKRSVDYKSIPKIRLKKNKEITIVRFSITDNPSET